MAVIQASDIGDLIRASLNQLHKGKLVELATDRQSFIVTKKLAKKGKVTFSSGPLWQWNVMINHNNSAEAVGLYHVDNVNATDVLIQAQVPWRRLHASYPIDHHEITMNSGESKINDMMTVRRLSCKISLVEKIEDRFWRLPATTDNLNMYGVPYWVVKNNTEGHNGGHPSGYSDVAGISRTANSRWKNYTAQYTAVTKDDLIAKIRRAMEFTDFTPPVEGIPNAGTSNDYGLYSNWNVVGTLAQLAEAQNDQLGTDVASMDGRVTVMRNAVARVTALEADTTNPLYGLNFGYFKVAAESGWWMKETVVDQAAKQHNVTEYHIDLSFQPYCYDCRRQFVIATDTGLPD